MSNYIQYGCGLSAPEGWENFDASPTLRIQRIPLMGKIVTNKMVTFPRTVKYGDIVFGLPGIEENSCDGIYCSHVLEHLSLNDFRKAIRQTYKYLKKGGIFRCVVPDLEFYINQYVNAKNSDNESAALEFMDCTLLGISERPKGIKGLLVNYLGNSHHLWMWDNNSLTNELQQARFSSVRKCRFNDSSDEKFKLVEEFSRFSNALALEAIK